ncbi:MAG: hypothetical protein WCI05_13590 [Myxococcales bacterium]
MPESSSSTPTVPTRTEVVHRPAAGLARGHWEAPAWGFYAAGVFAVLLVLVVVFRSLRTARSRPTNP